MFLFVRPRTLLFPLLLACGLSAVQCAAEDLILIPADSTYTIGLTVSWTVALSSAAAPPARSRYELRRDDGTLVASRFSGRSFDWIAADIGIYTLHVVAQDDSGRTIASADKTFTVTSTVPLPFAAPSKNPLVATYVATCDSGQMRVLFAPPNTPFEQAQFTPFQPCRKDKPLVFVITGMHAAVTYELQGQVVDGFASQMLDPVRFTTGDLPKSVLDRLISFDPATLMPLKSWERILLQSYVNGGPVAFDNDGTPLWYYVDPDFSNTLLVHTVAGGSLLFITGDSSTLRETDLAGDSLREIRVEEVSSQLGDLGFPPVIAFHHDAVRLPGASTAVLASVVRIIDQGSGPDKVVGDMVIVLDRNWRVAWAWNSFDKLDIARGPVLGERCSIGCGAPEVDGVDWTHSNAIVYTADHSLLVSVRHQDWIVKIDYRDGKGTGNVLWRLGPGGDFTTDSTVANPWFSHQHAPVIWGSSIALFDNGNTRVAYAGGNSRGQVWTLDEDNRIAHLDLNADLGSFSSALGSAQRLASGNFEFLSGAVGSTEGYRTEGTEIEASTGNTATRFEAPGLTYRNFRLTSLYAGE